MKDLFSTKMTFPLFGLFLLLFSLSFLVNGCEKEEDPEELTTYFTVEPEKGTTSTILRFTPYVWPEKYAGQTNFYWDFDNDGIIDWDGAPWDDELWVDYIYNEEGVYTAKLDVRATDGSTASFSKTISIADLNNCHPDFNNPCPNESTVLLDGRAYKTVSIGNQCWMAENLDWGEIVSSSGASDNAVVEKTCYEDDPANCEKYGGLYTWHEAMDYKSDPGTAGICPVGWHIPTIDEWDELSYFLGGHETIAGKLMACESEQWTNGDRSTNSSGFTALPSGYHWIWFEYEGARTWFWTSDSQNDEEGIVVSMDREQDGLTEVYANKYYSACVRCVRD